MAKPNKKDKACVPSPIADELQPEEDMKFSDHIKQTFEKALSNPRIKLAAVVFTIDDDEEPHLYRKGHFYDTAVLMNHVMRVYRSKAAIELGL
jgi:hypothetical protein